jgi:HEAT repeat protein
LGWIGEPAKPAVPALISAAKNRHSSALPIVQPVAASALGLIGDARPDVVAMLTGLLKDERVQSDGNNYSAVVYALGRLGPEARDAVPVLLEQLQDKTNRNRWYVLSALRGIGPGAAAAVPTLARSVEAFGQLVEGFGLDLADPFPR